MFNYAMSGSLNSYSNTTLGKLSSNSSVVVGNGCYNLLHIVYGNDESNPIPTTWQDNTIMLADFQFNLNGGNTDSSWSRITALRIKRKETAQSNSRYVTIYEKKINDTTDATLTVYDNYARAGVTYTYAVCPVLNDGTEGALYEVTVKSDFCGIVICDADKLYFTDLEPSYSFDKNSNMSLVTTLTSRYPYVIHNNVADYWSGSVSGMWVGMIGCEYDIDNQFNFRKSFYDWLNNGESKILKFDDGREWLICVTGGIKEQADNHWLKVITSFDWTEIGDYDSSDDLLRCGLIQKSSG